MGKKCDGMMGCTYFLGFAGSAVYFVQQASSFGAGVVGFLIFIYLYLKLIFWAPMSIYLLIVTAIPMMLGNIIVNFPYTIVFSIILILILKDTNAKNSSSYSLKR